MSYIRALAVSFLLHSLAFASSYVLLNQYFVAHRIVSIPSNIQGPFLTVSVINAEPNLKAFAPSRVSLSNKKITKNAKASKLQTAETAAVSASCSPTLNSATQTAFQQNEDGDGGANLIPHPDNQPPQYPESARKEGLTGNMILELTVNTKGSVDWVEIKEGKKTSEILQKTAIDAIKVWRFLYKTSPKAPVKIQVPVVFSLD